MAASTLNPAIVNLTKSIALAESGNGKNVPNYNAVGDNGTSKGAYQWQPGNYEAAAKEAGFDPGDFSPAAQNKVAYYQVQKMHNEGLSPDQIAAAWNAGEKRARDGSWKNNIGTTTINGKPLAYNTPEYVKKVNGYYLQLAGGKSAPAPSDPSAPPVVAPKKSLWETITGAAQDVSTGVAKGELATAQGLGQLPLKATDALGLTHGAGESTYFKDKTTLQPKNTGEVVGKGGEQVAEFFVPGGAAEKLATKADVAIKGAEIGGKALSKVLGGAAKIGIRGGTNAAVVAGQTGSPTQGVEAGTIGEVVGAPLAGAAKVVPKLLSYTSGVPEEAFKTLLARRGQVVSDMKKGVTPMDALKTGQGAVKTLRKTLTQDWQTATGSLVNEFQGQRMTIAGTLAGKLQKVSEEFGVDLPQNIKNVSVKEAIALLKNINELPSAVLSMSPKGAIVRQVKDELKQKVISTFGGEKGNVANLYRNYSARKGILDAADSILASYKTGKPIQQTTAQNRLQALFDDNKTEYLKSILDLEKATGVDILSKVTASKFGRTLPEAFNPISSKGGLLGPKGILEKGLELLAFPLTSPRFASMITRLIENEGKLSGVGQAAKGVVGKTVSDFINPK